MYLVFRKVGVSPSFFDKAPFGSNISIRAGQDLLEQQILSNCSGAGAA